MTKVNDETLLAYLDGELDDIARRRVEQALAEDGELEMRLESQRRLRERLARHYDPVAQEAVPERFRSMLDSNVSSLAEARARRAPRAWRNSVAIAATLVLGLALGQALPRDQGPVVVRDGVMIAGGDLADSLDTQLASAPAGAHIRIGVTFATSDGRLCRTFENSTLSGLACREDQDWRLLMTAGGGRTPAGGYRQASSASARIMEAAQELMAGEPLDSAGERRARDSGWRNLSAAD